MSNLLLILRPLLPMLPFVLLVLLGNRNNLKKFDRSRQCYMPLAAVVFCIVVGILLKPLSDMVANFVLGIARKLAGFALAAGLIPDGALSNVLGALADTAAKIDYLVKQIDLAFWAETLLNSFVVIIYLVFKRIALTVLKGVCKDDATHYELVSKLAYQKREDNRRYLKPHMEQGVTMAKALYYAAVIFGVFGVIVSSFLLKKGLISSIYYPVFSVIMLGELYFFLDGERWQEESSSLTGEADRATRICDYTFLREVLSRNFGDKLMSDNTSVNSGLFNVKTNDELVEQLVQSEEAAIEAYGLFMKKKVAAGLDVDQNYLDSGLNLLAGKSVIFNNPFYYDLIPYVFFPMNRTILRRKKVLIVLGRHAMEQDAEQWCRKGLTSVNHIPSLWSIEVLGKERKDPDVGIVTRSSVHDLQMHEQNAEFFKDVEFVVLIEPSRLIATAQIGLNSLVRHCRRDGKKLVFCSTDKNCDGLVDALSHILMTSLEEVTATNKHTGTNSYMCWEADEEHLQHRMLPNLSRYLGVGTELSFTALKNQISRTAWYGGDAFPVQDMHWVAKQYYYDLLRFASLPTVQATFDEVFEASANMWNAQVRENNYITVEDESFNMYEAKRAFATRAKNQGFVNVISTDYLLKDYMAANDGIFDADSKAVPYIVADYAHTHRNVVYRLCLRLTAYPQVEEDIRGELALINVDLGEDLRESLWSQICKIARASGEPVLEERTHRELLTLRKDGKQYTFNSDVIREARKYSFKTGRMEMMYSIEDQRFVDVFLADLCSAEYVAEDETDKNRFLGSELRGHIFQKYLPGQFFTFGGKYYEMQRLALDGRVIVRRAADHINGRPQYRQVRKYTISNVSNSTGMGDQRDIGGIMVTKQNADIQVETPAYWRMRRYNDFRTGKKVAINGVPTRNFYNKQLLRIDFPQELVPDGKVLDTIALLMNELFRTLYAENQGLIVAVTPGEAQAPVSYWIEGEDLQENSLYIIEDSQLDIGFLISVERNLTRIFSILCDYLQWNGEMMEASLNPPPVPVKPDFTLTEEQRQEEKAQEAEAKKQKGIRGWLRKLKEFFKKLWDKLFKRKPKEPKPEEPAQEAPVEESPAEETSETPVEEVSPAEETPAEEIPAEEAPEEEIPALEAPEEEVPALEAPEEEIPAEEAPEEEIPTEEEIPAEEEAPAEEETPAEEDTAPALLNVMPPKRLYSLVPSVEELAAQMEATEEEIPTEEATEEEIPAEEAPQEEVPAEEAPAEEEIPAEEIPAEEVPAEEATEEAPAEESSEGTITVEPEEAVTVEPEQKPAQPEKLQRRPYHERPYLHYGGDEVPESLDIAGALDLLRGLGFGKGSLEQARNGLTETENVERNFTPDRKGSHYCDFCGTELFGSEYELLADGRERCMLCGRTAVKTEREFKRIYKEIIRNLSIFYGINITVPVNIQMVNAKKLHKHLGQTFIPTGKADGRVLGVAIKHKNGYTIMLENGAPRMSAIMTMVHELTHIWQYLNWDAAKILQMYGNRQNLEIYEGMAKWVEIQYAYLLNEAPTAKREEIITRLRQDPYGWGFVKYTQAYPLSTGTRLLGDTPFAYPEKPL